MATATRAMRNILALSVVVVIVMSEVRCNPVLKRHEDIARSSWESGQRRPRRFVTGALTRVGFLGEESLAHTRTRRNVAEQCEQRELCLIHARSQSSLFGAFQLYFVNKENAKLWDHAYHSREECHRRFPCYEE